MRHLQLAFPVAVALMLASCNQGQPTVSQGNPAAQAHIILLHPDSAVVGQTSHVTIEALDTQGNHIQVAPEDLMWESEDSSKLRVDAPGVVTPLSTDAVNLRVRTLNNSTYTDYEVTAHPFALQFLINETSVLATLAADGRSFSQLDSSWIGKTVNVYGNTCTKSGPGDECGECTAFAKAFGNQIGPSNQTSTWRPGTSVLTRGANPTLKPGVYLGDAVATFNGSAYSGHVALFNGYSNGVMNVKDQNWNINGSYRINYHGISVKNRPNGVPTCSTTFNTITDDACNYLKVTL